VHTHLRHLEEKQKEREEAAGTPLPGEATESGFWARQEKPRHLSLEKKWERWRWKRVKVRKYDEEWVMSEEVTEEEGEW